MVTSGSVAVLFKKLNSESATMNGIITVFTLSMLIRTIAAWDHMQLEVVGFIFCTYSLDLLPENLHRGYVDMY